MQLIFKILLSVCLLYCSVLQAQQTKEMGELYFPNALIYQYEYRGEKGELWIYHNPQTGNMLYAAPGDDMMDAVISYPDGNYTSYFQTEAGKFNSYTQLLSDINKEWTQPKELEAIKTTAPKYYLIDNNKIAANAFQINYLKAASETVWTTNAISGNAHQFYGFYRLQGDAQIQLPIDYAYFLNKEEWLTEVHNPYFKLKLIAYEHNPYWFNTSKYQP